MALPMTVRPFKGQLPAVIFIVLECKALKDPTQVSGTNEETLGHVFPILANLRYIDFYSHNFPAGILVKFMYLEVARVGKVCFRATKLEI